MIVFLALILLYYIVCEQGARFSKYFQDFYENTISTVNGQMAKSDIVCLCFIRAAIDLQHQMIIFFPNNNFWPICKIKTLSVSSSRLGSKELLWTITDNSCHWANVDLNQALDFENIHISGRGYLVWIFGSSVSLRMNILMMKRRLNYSLLYCLWGWKKTIKDQRWYPDAGKLEKIFYQAFIQHLACL